MLIPLGRIIGHIMFPTPRSPSPLASLQNLVSQTAQCPYLRNNIRQLTDCIINFHLTSLAMPLICKVFYFVCCNERIIDKWIQIVGMMHIDDFNARFQVLFTRNRILGTMVVPICKLAVTIRFLYRSDQQG